MNIKKYPEPPIIFFVKFWNFQNLTQQFLSFFYVGNTKDILIISISNARFGGHVCTIALTTR